LRSETMTQMKILIILQAKPWKTGTK